MTGTDPTRYLLCGDHLCPCGGSGLAKDQTIW